MTVATVDIAPRLSAMFVGDSSWQEFEQVRQDLQANTLLTQAANLDAAAAWIAKNDAQPDLIVIAQTRPGQVNERQVHALRHLVPLARCVGVLGSWCEGEARTGRPWAAMPRLYWHQWPIAGLREIQRLADARDSWWLLPHTAAPDERFLVMNHDDLEPQIGLVMICSADWESSETLADLCAAAGYRSVWHRRDKPPRTHGAQAVVWNGSGLDADAEQELRRLSQEFAGVLLVALLNYPRVEDVRRALQCGVTSVLSKPFLVEDLLAELARGTSKTYSQGSRAKKEVCKLL